MVKIGERVALTERLTLGGAYRDDRGRPLGELAVRALGTVIDMAPAFGFHVVRFDSPVGAVYVRTD